MNISIKNLTTFFILSLLTVSAFLVRLENIKNTKLHSIDEIVYYRMAQQVLQEGLLGYHTIPYGEEMAASGRKLPPYFFKPLFKHPPVFTFLVALSIKIFGHGLIEASYLPLLISVLMIPLIYISGRMASNHYVGMLAAMLLWLDPVHIICSQKIWMDATIAFFTLLAITLFIYALKYQKNFSFLLSGLASGMAVNTKYTGILVTIAMGIFALLYRRDLFRNKSFHLSLFLPFLMLIPWIIWNSRVLGWQHFLPYQEVHNIFRQFEKYQMILILIGIISGAFYLLKKKLSLKSDLFCRVGLNQTSPCTSLINGALIACIFILGFHENILNSLNPFHIPTHSWAMGVFHNSPVIFYFGRLIEFSPLYILGIIYMIKYAYHENDNLSFLRLSCILILVFFSGWGAFQSRYILPAIPGVILLSSHYWDKAMDKCQQDGYRHMTGRLALKALLIFTLLKMSFLAYSFSFTNNMCYF